MVLKRKPRSCTIYGRNSPVTGVAGLPQPPHFEIRLGNGNKEGVDKTLRHLTQNVVNDALSTIVFCLFFLLRNKFGDPLFLF